jgi:hypothetical protein
MIIEYHNPQLLRVLGLVVIFGVLWPMLCLIFVAGRALTMHLIRQGTHDSLLTLGSRH